MARKRAGRTKKAGVGESVKRYVYAVDRRISLSLRNLVLFIVLALISYMLYKVLNLNSLFSALFSLLTIIFGFVALAFFIVLLIFLALRIAKKPVPERTASAVSRKARRKRR